MASVPSTGEIKLQDIADTFGSPEAPNPLGDYYSDGSFVKVGEFFPTIPPIPPRRNVGSSTNNEIKFSDFRGKGKRKPYSFNVTTNTADLNIFNFVKSTIQNEPLDVDVTVTIDSGVTVYGSSPTSPALIVPANTSNRSTGFRSDDNITIINNGNIIGAGGAGGAGGCGLDVNGSGGTNGGDGISLGRAVSITNNGTIAGGSRGGNGGTGGRNNTPINCNPYNCNPVQMNCVSCNCTTTNQCAQTMVGNQCQTGPQISEFARDGWCLYQMSVVRQYQSGVCAQNTARPPYTNCLVNGQGSCRYQSFPNTCPRKPTAPSGMDSRCRMGVICWVARAAWGIESTTWLEYRSRMLEKAPLWFINTYIAYGPTIALHVNTPLRKAFARGVLRFFEFLLWK